MEVDPLFIGPAALAKAYRFVGDPRDAQQFERLKDLAEDPHGIYDCTHCFKCIEACPKGVAPMSQIMRLRRRAGDDHDINDRNNGHRHEKAFVEHHRGQRPAARGRAAAATPTAATVFGKFAPPSALELIDSLPVDHARRCCARKVTPPKARCSRHKLPKDDLKQVKRIYDDDRGPRRAHRAQPLHRRRRGRADDEARRRRGRAEEDAAA